jgi:hypothetical protein
MGSNRLTGFGRSGITSFGVPVLPGNLPFGVDSKVFFVAPYRTETNGASDGNDGLSPKRALKTVFGTNGAFSKCRANKNDTIVMLASGDSASETTEDITTEQDWNKDLVHLIGTSRNKYGQRCRFNNTGTDVTPMITISGSGCVFANFQIFCGNDDGNLVACEVTGNHNYFENIHFAGMGTTALAGVAGATSLKVNGGTENVWKDCIIGLDTIARDGDSKGELWFDGGASRMWFEGCLFTTYLSADNQTVTVEDSTGIDRTIVFKDCMFFAKSDNAATAQTTVFSIPAISQGAIILWNSFAGTDGGAAEWDSGDRNIIWNNSVAAAAAGAGGILTTQ